MKFDELYVICRPDSRSASGDFLFTQYSLREIPIIASSMVYHELLSYQRYSAAL